MNNNAKTKILRCPVCGARLIDSAKNIMTELIPQEDAENEKMSDYYQKCNKCKRLIGIKKVS